MQANNKHPTHQLKVSKPSVRKAKPRNGVHRAPETMLRTPKLAAGARRNALAVEENDIHLTNPGIHHSGPHAESFLPKFPRPKPPVKGEPTPYDGHRIVPPPPRGPPLKGKPVPGDMPPPMNVHDNRGEHDAFAEPSPSASEMLQGEEDPDMLKATMDLLSTPHSNANTETAMELIENVQFNCAADFESVCDQNVVGMSLADSLVSFIMNGVFAPSDAGNVGSQRKLMHGFEPFKPQHSLLSFLPDPSKSHHLRESGFIGSDDDGAGDDKDAGDDDGAGDDKDAGDDDGNYRADDDFTVDDVNAIGGVIVVEAPTPDQWLNVRGSAHETVDPKDIAHAYDEPNRDFYEEGSLGYGYHGDQCIYNNFDTLSPQCQDAIQAVDDFRHNYWNQEQQIAHMHDNGGFVVVCLVIFAVLGYKRFNKRARQYREITKKNDDVMEIIHQQPHLKQAVEEAYGQALPVLKSSIKNEKSCCGQVCKFIGCIVLAVIITVSSIHTTRHIMGGMVFKDEDGNEHPAPGGLVLLVLFSIITVKLLVLVLLVRCMRYCCRKFRGESSGANDNSPDAQSSTVMPAIYSGVSALRNALSSATTASTGSALYTRWGGNSDYAPLARDDAAAEMTTFAPAPVAPPMNPMSQHQMQQPAPRQNQMIYTGVPVHVVPHQNNTYNYNRMV